MSADSMSYDSHRGGTAVPAYLPPPTPGLPPRCRHSFLFPFSLPLSFAASVWTFANLQIMAQIIATATRDMRECRLAWAASRLSLFSMLYVVVVFVVFLPSHALPFSTEEGKKEKEKLIKAEMKRAGGRPKTLASAKPSDNKRGKAKLTLKPSMTLWIRTPCTWAARICRLTVRTLGAAGGGCSISMAA